MMQKIFVSLVNIDPLNIEMLTLMPKAEKNFFKRV